MQNPNTDIYDGDIRNICIIKHTIIQNIYTLEYYTNICHAHVLMHILCIRKSTYTQIRKHTTNTYNAYLCIETCMPICLHVHIYKQYAMSSKPRQQHTTYIYTHSYMLVYICTQMHDVYTHMQHVCKHNKQTCHVCLKY